MSTYNAVAFYVVGHLDDWQLFMNPNASRDLAEETNKVVFVHTTGDDAGDTEVFWKAKEEAVVASIRLRLSPRYTSRFDEVRDTVEANGHNVHRWTGANAACYFLRIPDGNGDGSGFERYGFQSLHKLRTGAIDSATTVEGAEEYHGWQDLVDTLEAIITLESEGIAAVCVDHPETDAALNPGDHSDHVTTGLAVQAMGNYTSNRRVLHVGYSIIDNPADLAADDLFWKVAMFTAYDKVVFDLAGYSTIREGWNYIAWCLRSAKFRELT